jgi:ferredoxin-NADP reductase
MTDPLSVLVVRNLVQEADDVLGLTLEHPDGALLPEWSPGAHMDLVLKPGMVRQYSLCGEISDRRSYQIAVLRDRDGRGGSEFVHNMVKEGDELTVRGPRNHFHLVDARKYIFIAGGIGVTPILPMVKQVAQSDAEFSVLYGGRRRSTMAFVEQLARYGSRTRIVPEDSEGLLDLDSALRETTPETKVYCCGPEGLISAVEQLCARLNLDALHVERFNARASESRAVASGRGLRVLLARSGVEVVVPPDRSILDVVLESGVDVTYDCAEGVCGSCETKVLEGDIEHLDEVLTKWEKQSNSVMMICCSRARGNRIVLDL